MKLHRIIVETDVQGRPKASIVPFLADGRCLFMISSNPAYGGPDPAIAKGKIDAGEDSLAAAIREGEEELGLRKANMATKPWLAWAGALSGMDETYMMDVFAVLVKDQDSFGATDKETARTEWLTKSEFTTKGRKSHAQIMDRVFNKVEAYLRSK